MENLACAQNVDPDRSFIFLNWSGRLGVRELVFREEVDGLGRPESSD